MNKVLSTHLPLVVAKGGLAFVMDDEAAAAVSCGAYAIMEDSACRVAKLQWRATMSYE
jgi:hypothetical protein